VKSGKSAWLRRVAIFIQVYALPERGGEIFDCGETETFTDFGD